MGIRSGVPCRSCSSPEGFLFFLDTAALLCRGQVEIRVEQEPYGLIGIEIYVMGAEERDKSIQGSCFNPHQVQGAEDVELVQLTQWWECDFVPDGVDDDVGDRIERAVAMASLEHAPVVPRPQVAARHPGESLQVETMDRM